MYIYAVNYADDKKNDNCISKILWCWYCLPFTIRVNGKFLYNSTTLIPD